MDSACAGHSLGENLAVLGDILLEKYIIHEINENAMYLKYAVQENENRWHTFNVETWPNYNIWGSYNNEVQGRKDWFLARMEWLKYQFSVKM